MLGRVNNVTLLVCRGDLASGFLLVVVVHTLHLVMHPSSDSKYQLHLNSVQAVVSRVLPQRTLPEAANRHGSVMD